MGIEGSKPTRITEPGISHSSTWSEDGTTVLDRAETIEIPPSTTLHNVQDKSIVTLGESDLSLAQSEGITAPEQFTFKAEDGTDLYGVLYKPSNFDPNRSYPLVLDVYGGPLSKRIRARYRAAYPETEFGVIIAMLDNRGTTVRGKAFGSATCLRLGDVETYVIEIVEEDHIKVQLIGELGAHYINGREKTVEDIVAESGNPDIIL